LGQALEKAERLSTQAQAWALDFAPDAYIKCVQYKGHKILSTFDILRTDVKETVHRLISEGFYVDWKLWYKHLLKVWDTLELCPSWDDVWHERHIEVQTPPTLSPETLALHKELISDLIKFLEGAKKRPGMYLYVSNASNSNSQPHRIHTLRVDALRNFLHGVDFGFEKFGLQPEWHFKREFELERGWDACSNQDSDSCMRAAGLLPDEIFLEYIEIHTEMWRRTLKKLETVNPE
jgi:hypothetical protein